MPSVEMVFASANRQIRSVVDVTVVAVLSGLVGLLLCLILVKVIWRLVGPYRKERARMPRELSRARLVLSEVNWYTRCPVPIHGRFDQVFLTKDQAVLLETKRRPRVYRSDIIQLSAQAYMLNHHPNRNLKGRPVAPHGFVRTIDASGASTYRRVSLLTDRQVEALYASYLRVQTVPTNKLGGPKSPQLCRDCGHRSTCPNRL